MVASLSQRWVPRWPGSRRILNSTRSATGRSATQSYADSHTESLKDFPQDRLDPYGIEAQHPDAFLTHLFALNPGAVVRAAQEHRASLKNPAKSVEEYLDTLERQGLTQTVAELRGYASVP
ncbi:MAG: hypothetical protein ACE5JI_14980 [Acidobacteriota bacterium]